MTMKTLYVKIINIAKPVLWIKYAASVHILGEKNELKKFNLKSHIVTTRLTLNTWKKEHYQDFKK